jgi:hypothetical protein
MSQLPVISTSFPRRSRQFLAKLKTAGKFDNRFRRRDSEPVIASPTSPTRARPSGFNPQYQQHQHQVQRKHVSGAGNFDLSLGQERAGGGAAGKQAKMGKLIIEEEGLMMLDLLVAANLGLWWRAYEKS